MQSLLKGIWCFKTIQWTFTLRYLIVKWTELHWNRFTSTTIRSNSHCSESSRGCKSLATGLNYLSFPVAAGAGGGKKSSATYPLLFCHFRAKYSIFRYPFSDLGLSNPFPFLEIPYMFSYFQSKMVRIRNNYFRPKTIPFALVQHLPIWLTQ